MYSVYNGVEYEGINFFPPLHKGRNLTFINGLSDRIPTRARRAKLLIEIYNAE